MTCTCSWLLPCLVVPRWFTGQQNGQLLDPSSVELSGGGLESVCVAVGGTVHRWIWYYQTAWLISVYPKFLPTTGRQRFLFGLLDVTRSWT